MSNIKELLTKIETSRGLPTKYKNNTELKKYTIKELYKIRYDVDGLCVVCNNDATFLNYKKGFKKTCSRRCANIYNKDVVSFENATLEDTLLFLKETFLIKNKPINKNTSNMITKSYFINNNKLSVWNYLTRYYGSIKIKDIYDIIFGCSLCDRCLKESIFLGFVDGYRKFCSTNCSISKKHLITKEILESYITNNTFKRNKFMIDYNCSESFIRKRLHEYNLGYIKTQYEDTNKFKFEISIMNEFKDIFVLNDRIQLNGLELDLYSEEHNLAIECNGILWHSYGKDFPNTSSTIRSDKHLLKTKKCEHKGIKLLHFTDIEYKNKRDVCLSVIKREIVSSNKICDFYIKDNIDVKDFYELNSFKSYSFKNNAVLYNTNKEILKILSYYEYQKDCYYIDFVSKNYDCNLFGYKELMDCFVSNHEPSTIEVICNRANENDFYEYIGFELKEISEPKAFYFKTNENILQEVKDKNIDELMNNGYRVIYDSGNKVYFKKF